MTPLSDLTLECGSSLLKTLGRTAVAHLKEQPHSGLLNQRQLNAMRMTSWSAFVLWLNSMITIRPKLTRGTMSRVVSKMGSTHSTRELSKAKLILLKM